MPLPYQGLELLGELFLAGSEANSGEGMLASHESPQKCHCVCVCVAV